MKLLGKILDVGVPVFLKVGPLSEMMLEATHFSEIELNSTRPKLNTAASRACAVLP